MEVIMTNNISLKEVLLDVQQDRGKNIEIINEDSAAQRLMNRRLSMKKVLRYVISTIATASFGAVYEYFSFGVFSYYMLYAFAFPLVLGALPWMLIAMDVKCTGRVRFPGQQTINFWGAGITTFTVGAILHGVLDIYGTTSTFTKYYFIAGAVLLLTAFIIFISDKDKRESEECTEEIGTD